MTKPDKIYLIFQLILVNCILFTLETLTWPWNFFWSPTITITIITNIITIIFKKNAPKSDKIAVKIKRSLQGSSVENTHKMLQIWFRGHCIAVQWHHHHHHQKNPKFFYSRSGEKEKKKLKKNPNFFLFW